MEEETRYYGVSRIIAASFIARQLRARDVIEIPSLGVSMNGVFRRDHKGGSVRGYPWAVDYLRQWLDEREVWDLLETLSPIRLARLGAIVKRAVQGGA